MPNLATTLAQLTVDTRNQPEATNRAITANSRVTVHGSAARTKTKRSSSTFTWRTWFRILLCKSLELLQIFIMKKYSSLLRAKVEGIIAFYLRDYGSEISLLPTVLVLPEITTRISLTLKAANGMEIGVIGHWLLAEKSYNHFSLISFYWRL